MANTPEDKRVAAEQKRVAAEQKRAAAELSSFADRLASRTNPITPPRRRSGRRPSHGVSRDLQIERSIPALLPPATKQEMDASRRKAEAQGWLLFGHRLWFLVQRDGKFRAVEMLEDTPGWELVAEMKR